jgi:L-ascorbate metabolism protein UlaG (beta-lactamase superfamily)
MGADNAIICSDFVKCDEIIGMHYDTFPLIQINQKEAKEKFSRAGKNLTLMKIGETMEFQNSEFKKTDSKVFGN